MGSLHSRTFSVLFLVVAAGLLAAAVPAKAAGDAFRLVDAGGKPVAGAHVAIVGRADRSRRLRTGVPLEVEPTPFRSNSGSPIRAAPGSARSRPDRVAGKDGGSPSADARTAEVEIRSSVAPSTLAPPASASVLVTRAEMTERLPSRLADTLTEMPGTGRIEEGQSVVPSVRGLARGRTLLMLDDGRVTAERRVGPSASWLNPFSLENVEVVRGPGTVASTAPTLSAAWCTGGLRSRTSATFGAATADRRTPAPRRRGSASRPTSPSAPTRSRARSSSDDYRDYESPSGDGANSSARDRGGLVGLSARRLRDALGRRTSSTRSARWGSPLRTRPSTRGPGTRRRTRRASPSARTLPGALGFRRPGPRVPRPVRSRHDRRRAVDADDVPLSLGGERRREGLVAPCGRSEADRNRAPSMSGSKPSAGSTFTRRTSSTTYSLSGLPVSTISEVAVRDAKRTTRPPSPSSSAPALQRAVGLGRPARRRRLVAELRRVLRRPVDVGRGFSGMLALTWTPATHSGSPRSTPTAFASPTLSDRYFRGVSGRGFVVGNPDLEPETSNQWDLTVRGRVGPGASRPTATYYRIYDLVERYRSGYGLLLPERWRGEITGAELQADVRFEAARRSVLRRFALAGRRSR